jgi:cytoskeleton protein RodZ
MGPKVAMVEQPKADFGARMKRTREERGVSLRQIADRTKLSVSALEALERNDIGRLPGGIFSRGFVRSYAIEIGLDPEQTVRDFLIQFPNDSVSLGSPHASAAEFAEYGTTRRSSAGVILVVVVALLIAAILIFVFARP